MKHKILMSGLLGLLMVTSVLALTVAFSLRGTGGVIERIGNDYNLQPTKIAFSANSNGGGGLQVYGRANGARVVLNVNMDQVSVIDNGVVITSYNTGRATYFKSGEGRSRVTFNNIVYQYNRNTGLTTVWGTSTDGLTIKVSGIQTVNLK